MARQLPRERPLSRRPPRYSANVQLTVFCEGENTEPDYLRSFSFEWGNRLVKLMVVPGVGVPMTVVRAAIKEKKRLENAAIESGDSFAARFQVWAVFDMDQHPNVKQAKNLAASAGISVGVSNPCFELWALLHFRDQDGHIERHAVQTDLQKVMPRYNRKNAKMLDYDAMRNGYTDACKRATRLCKRRLEEGTPGGNPSTDINRLLDVIVVNGVRN